MTPAQIDNLFTYHPPSRDQLAKYEVLRTEARKYAHLINEACPESREKSLAITYLQIANMLANASIAIAGAGPAAPGPIPESTMIVKDGQLQPARGERVVTGRPGFVERTASARVMQSIMQSPALCINCGMNIPIGAQAFRVELGGHLKTPLCNKCWQIVADEFEGRVGPGPMPR